jgi:uncharacterized membrane protein YeaQ/YmgE (transglycosylase-associated protein family)
MELSIRRLEASFNEGPLRRASLQRAKFREENRSNVQGADTLCSLNRKPWAGPGLMELGRSAAVLEGHNRSNPMEDQQVGWIAAIIIGGIAGWLAEMFMKSNTGLLMNIVLGIVGAAIASFLFGLLGIQFAGWIGYLVAGFIGACILIGIVRAVRT